VNTDVKDVSGT